MDSNLLTKARLDQYIKDNELVPIGTELETIQLGKCKVILHVSNFWYRCANEKGEENSYNKEFKCYAADYHTSLISPTPSTVENPFSKEMLEQMVSDVEDIRKVVGYSDTRGKIISTCNHLLTNANELPKEMYVWDSDKEETDPLTENVVYIDPMNRFVVTLDDSGHPSAWKHARPIEQKQKELKDLKEGSKCYVVGQHQELTFGSCRTVEKHDVFGLGVKKNDGLYIALTPAYFSPYPPTPEQFTAAEEAAINEVKQRFEGLRKGGQGNG